MSYVWPILMIFLTGAVPALLFILLLWKRYWALIPVLLLIMIILETAVTVLLLYGGGFFGAGALCVAVPVAACAMIVLIGARAALFRSFGEDKSRRRWYLVGIFLIPLVLLAPLLEEFLLIGGCDALNRRTGDAIIRALDAYKQDHGAYPEKLEALVPTYIPVLPFARCFAPYRWSRGSDSQESHNIVMGYMGSMWTDGAFKLHQCPHEGMTLLIVPSVLFDFVERYNLTTGSGWSRTSLLDGICTFVR
jgi:hypothetical protein